MREQAVRPHDPRMAGGLPRPACSPSSWSSAPPATPFAAKRSIAKGLLDLQAARSAPAWQALDFFNDPQALAKQEELQAMDDGRRRHDRLCRPPRRQGAGNGRAREKNAARKRELLRIAAVCERVPAQAPRDFHEALQHYWFIHLGVISEANPWDAFNPGRLDQHLLPFYRRGLADGSLTREKARELLQAFWVKFNNHPSPPKVGVTAEESGTYTDFALINTGGLDPEGEDGVNEVSFLILDVIEEMRLLQPSSMVQVSKKSPDAFLHRALKIVGPASASRRSSIPRPSSPKCCARGNRWPTPAAAAPAAAWRPAPSAAKATS